MADYEIVTDAHADTVVAREIARPGSSTQRALTGWATSNGGIGGGAIGGVTGLTDNGDGTATITFSAASGVIMTRSGDGTTATLTFTT